MRNSSKFVFFLLLLGGNGLMKCWRYTNPDDTLTHDSDITLESCDPDGHFCMKADFYPPENLDEYVPWAIYGCSDEVLDLSCQQPGSYNLTNYRISNPAQFGSPNVVSDIFYRVEINCCNNADYCNSAQISIFSVFLATIISLITLILKQ
ncbi:unnamed protein product, partial [Mesorhabditis belari]|uniref:Uncharacterized protein n=1 Tax=Mesorhabditis belari TaxID=2138241 RepID=A0AAF3E9A9_9BILA